MPAELAADAESSDAPCRFFHTPEFNDDEIDAAQESLALDGV
jgi:hypothetical protein